MSFIGGHIREGSEIGWYRKKPVPVQAWQIVVGSVYPHWVADAIRLGQIVPEPGVENWGDKVTIKTKEGDLFAHPGQWLIRAMDGRIWPTDAEYFAANYEAAPDV